MKGFPNQVADLAKLAKAMQVIAGMVDAGEDAKDQDRLGEALVREGVAGTGHVPLPVDEYLRRQRQKRSKGDQSHRTAARGLRELFRLFGLLDDSGPTISLTPDGRAAASLAGAPLDGEQLEFWRRVIRNMQYTEAKGTSHPYQVLLRLVARQPHITRAKCALALEAADDSPEELDRIVQLAALDEAEIQRRLGVSDSNWANAKKMLPRFAEQLGDVIKTGGSYVLSDSPGRGTARTDEAGLRASRRGGGVRAPRSSRQVGPNDIGNAGLADRDEPLPPSTPDPSAQAAANAVRADRLRRHNLLVRAFASRLSGEGATLFEDPFDILAIFDDHGVLVEVKTLDGSEADERDRVRGALAQLLYYEAFVTSPIAGEVKVEKVACFESPPSQAHRDWLNRLGIATVWRHGDGFAGDALAASSLRGLVRPQ